MTSAPVDLERFERPARGGWCRLLPLVVLAAGVAIAPPGHAATPFTVEQAVAAGDLDGDGLGDVAVVGRATADSIDVEGRLEVAAQEVPPVVSVRSGRDGRELFTRTLTGQFGRARVVPTTLPTGPGLLVVTGPEDDEFGNFGAVFTAVGGPIVEADDARTILTVLNASGAVAWSRDLGEGVSAGVRVATVVPVGPRGRASAPYAIPVGAGDYLGNGSVDVLVTLAQRVEANGVAATLTRAQVIDGRTGLTALDLSFAGATSEVRVKGVGDLDADGTPDFVATNPATGITLAGYSGRDGKRLWTTAAVTAADTVFISDLGDVTGDGKSETSVYSDTNIFDDPDFIPALATDRAALVDGATGQVLSTSTGFHVAVGDVNGDGARDLVRQSGPSATRKLEQVTARGVVLRSRTFADSFATPVGDLDADGFTDFQAFSATSEPRLLSGRTLAPRNGFGEPVNGSLDGSGDDLYRGSTTPNGGTVDLLGIDGATLGTLWTSALPTTTDGSTSVSAVPDDTNRDGFADLIVSVFRFADEGVDVHLVDGRNGKVIFTLA